MGGTGQTPWLNLRETSWSRRGATERRFVETVRDPFLPKRMLVRPTVHTTSPQTVSVRVRCYAVPRLHAAPSTDHFVCRCFYLVFARASENCELCCDDEQLSNNHAVFGFAFERKNCGAVEVRSGNKRSERSHSPSTPHYTPHTSRVPRYVRCTLFTCIAGRERLLVTIVVVLLTPVKALHAVSYHDHDTKKAKDIGEKLVGRCTPPLKFLVLYFLFLLSLSVLFGVSVGVLQEGTLRQGMQRATSPS